MRPILTLAVSAGFASASWGATLSVTPDALTYQIGDTITLNVFGDPEDDRDKFVFGRLLFDGLLAEHVGSSQQPLTTSFGNSTWTQFELSGGDGFADAFAQLTGEPEAPTVPLVSTVVLEAVAPGVLGIEWDMSGEPLDFFDVGSAPGATILIVPEPSTAGLVLFAALVYFLARRRHHQLSRCLALVLLLLPRVSTAGNVCADFLEEHADDSKWQQRCIEWLQANEDPFLAQPLMTSSCSHSALRHVASSDLVLAEGVQNEVFVSVDPTDREHAFAIARTQPFSNALLSAFTDDCGTNWDPQEIGVGPGGDVPRAQSDPWAVFSEHGVLYISYLFDGAESDPSFGLDQFTRPTIVARWEEVAQKFCCRPVRL